MARRLHIPVGIILAAAAVLTGQSPDEYAPITNLATDSSGSVLYFTTWLRQRGSSQSPLPKVFGLTGTQLELVQQSAYNSIVQGAPDYTRPSVSSDGTVLAINAGGFCLDGSECLAIDLNSTIIRTPTGQTTYEAQADLSPNGKFALLSGVATVPFVALPPLPLQAELLDLTSGAVTVVGPAPAGTGQVVANDGSALIQANSGVVLAGPKGNIPLVPAYPINNVQLSADASRFLYDSYQANVGIRLLDIASGADTPVTPGSDPSLAADGHTFSYVNANQVWLGDAFGGAITQLTHEPEGIAEHVITGDGGKVFAATETGRVLVVDIASGNVTQLLDSAPPRFLGLATQPVPGSYNWVTGTSDTSLQVLIGGFPAISLGAVVNPSELVIQVPWEVQPGPSVAAIVFGKDSAWEDVIAYGVSAMAGEGVQLQGGNAAIHQDWSALVSQANPADPGEIVHMYGIGWGAVDGSVASGQPTPSNRLYRITAACQWQASAIFPEVAEPIDALFAGLAPGLIGLYQFDFQVPPDWASASLTPICSLSGGNTLMPLYAFPVAR